MLLQFGDIPLLIGLSYTGRTQVYFPFRMTNKPKPTLFRWLHTGWVSTVRYIQVYVWHKWKNKSAYTTMLFTWLRLLNIPNLLSFFPWITIGISRTQNPLTTSLALTDNWRADVPYIVSEFCRFLTVFLAGSILVLLVEFLAYFQPWELTFKLPIVLGFFPWSFMGWVVFTDPHVTPSTIKNGLKYIIAHLLEASANAFHDEAMLSSNADSPHGENIKILYNVYHDADHLNILKMLVPFICSTHVKDFLRDRKLHWVKWFSSLNIGKSQRLIASKSFWSAKYFSCSPFFIMDESGTRIYENLIGKETNEVHARWTIEEIAPRSSSFTKEIDGSMAFDRMATLREFGMNINPYDTHNTNLEGALLMDPDITPFEALFGHKLPNIVHYLHCYLGHATTWVDFFGLPHHHLDLHLEDKVNLKRWGNVMNTNNPGPTYVHYTTRDPTNQPNPLVSKKPINLNGFGSLSIRRRTREV